MQTLDGAPPTHPREVFLRRAGNPLPSRVERAAGAQFGKECGIRFKFHDASGKFGNGDVFELRFTPVPAPAAAATISLGLLVAGRRRR